MITPEPPKVLHCERVDLPSDQGLRSHFFWSAVSIPEMGAAGHLGVIEERCSGLHTKDSLEEDELSFPCPACGAAV